MALLQSTLGMIYTIRGDTSDVERKLNTLDNKVDSMAGGFDKGTFSATAFGSAIGNIAANAVSNLTSLLAEGAKAVFEYNEKLQATKLGLESLTGSAGKAAALFKDLEGVARNSPFSALDLTGMAQRLVGANVELKKVPILLRDIGNIVAATGEATVERFEGINTAITQIISKGRVSAEEMEQLAERGIPAWNLLSQALGKTIAETRKLAEDGKISADVMVQALQRMSQQKYGDAMAKQSELASVSIRKIKTESLAAAATAFQPWLKEIAQFASRMRSEVVAQKGDLSKIGETIVRYVGEGMGRAVGSMAQWFGNHLVTRLKEVFTQGKLFNKLGEAVMVDFWDGILNSFGVNRDKIERFRNAMKYALSFRLLAGESFDEYMKSVIPDSTNYTTPKVYDYTRPGDNKPITLDSTKETLEKQRREREESFKKQLADLEKYNRLEVESAQQNFKTFQDSADSLFEQGKLSLAQYIAQSWRIIEEYERQIKALMEKGFGLATAGKKGQELENERLAYKNALEKFNSEINDLKEKLYNTQETKQKEAAEKNLAVLENENQRKLALDKASGETRLAQLEADLEKGLITELDYANAVAAVKLRMLETEKGQLQELLKGLDKKSEKYAEVTNKIAILDEQLTQQQIANAKAVGEAIENLIIARDRLARSSGEASEGSAGDSDEEGGAPTPGIFSGMIRELKELFRLGGELPTLASVFQEFGSILANAFQGVAQAIGSVVQQWVLMGTTGPAIFRKIVAAALASIAAEAAVRAIYELAAGFASLFFNPAEAAAHFTAAALFGTIAVGSALAGRAIAGGAFRQQTASATGASAQSSSGNRAGGAYSSQQDQTINQSRNAPAGALANPTLTLKVDDRSGWLAKMFRIEWERNTDGFRTFILDDMAKA